MHGDTAVTARGHGHGQRNQFARFCVEMLGLLARAGKRLVASNGIRRKLAQFAHARHQFLAVLIPVFHQCLLSSSFKSFPESAEKPMQPPPDADSRPQNLR